MTGYPPQDLLFRNDFNKKIEFYKKKIINLTKKQKTIFALSLPTLQNKKIVNSLILIQFGKIIFSIQKKELPNYGVFDELRYFKSLSTKRNFFKFQNKKIEFLICEDMWSDKYLQDKIYKKLDFIIIINASPFEIGKFDTRKKLAARRAKFCKANLIYLNLVGSQDDLVFDGGSFAMNTSGRIIYQTSFFKESDGIIDFNKKIENKNTKKINENEHLYRALMEGVKNYMCKNNFESVILGLSGGIDSSLTLAILADTLDNSKISSFFLPSIYTSNKSREDAYSLSKNVAVNTKEISIEMLRKNVSKQLQSVFKNIKEDITEENIQSRLRGLILMALSNKFNSLLITTGNKSELAVGYSTLYGDMCGGYSLLKDIYKTKVFELCKWRNKSILNEFNVKKLNIIPNRIITKEPTAELKFDQFDKDSLPPYEVLDKILEFLIDENRDLNFIVNKGFKKETVKKIWSMIKNSEFKRYQSAIGPKVSKMSLSSDRRFPITNKFELQ